MYTKTNVLIYRTVNIFSFLVLPVMDMYIKERRLILKNVLSSRDAGADSAQGPFYPSTEIGI